MGSGCSVVLRGVQPMPLWWLSPIVPRTPYCPLSGSIFGLELLLCRTSGLPTMKLVKFQATPTKLSITAKTSLIPHQERTRNPSKVIGHALACTKRMMRKQGVMNTSSTLFPSYLLECLWRRRYEQSDLFEQHITEIYPL